MDIGQSMMQQSIDAKESSVFKFRDLVWPPAKSEDLMCIQKQVKFDYNYAGRQLNLSRVQTLAKSRRYTCTETRNNIKNKQPEVGWSKIPWFPKAISKHTFIGWLTRHSRFATN